MDTNKYCTYIRVSTQRQGQSGLGLEAQQEICNNYIKSKDGILLKEFKDVESGKSRTRAGLWSAIDYCKEYKCTLVVAKLDRLARDIEFTFKVINSGIDIYFCDMPIVNTMILGVFASIAQYERELTSARTKSALGARVARGEETGGTNNLWGKNTGSDRNVVLESVREKSACVRRERAINNPRNKFLWTYMKGKIRYVGGEENIDWTELSNELNELGQKTSSGLPFNRNRANAMYRSLKIIYKEE